MGLCMSSSDEQQLQNIKILLLGAGESGKSTVLKQVRMIYKGRMSAQDVRQCVEAIRRNAIESMQAVLQAMKVYGIPLEDEAKAAARTRIIGLSEDSALTKDVADDITALWNDGGVKACYEKRDLYWLLDAAAYYFNEVQRISDPKYEPTEEDVIMTRVRTTGIDHTEFIEHPYNWSVVDVGGQRNERRKWIHCFENVKAVVYLVGLSGYNQCLFEDASVNRMQESIKLFRQVVGNPIFKTTPVFVFLNKRDLFEQMIRKTSLRACFPEYSGPDKDPQAAIAYVENVFRSIMGEVCPGKQLYLQVVTARVRPDMQEAWTEVKDTLRGLYGPQGSTPTKPKASSSAPAPTAPSSGSSMSAAAPADRAKVQ
ncbi:GPA4, alpha subunit of a heterotrimeric G protein [Tribonema minus]|uniref:GPA4, alpha subunit of a heterotrimeric G protein n=1 Tax=Tribonema minus TaxID=303371 RepID=A0A835ZKP0_9STRA|nr:GPA4, alpha subunit of a heterotrimeric G protein [Tribonema minus]